MANGNVTLTNGKGQTKTFGAEAWQMFSKGTGVARIRNEDWWVDGEEKPVVASKPRPGQKIPEKKQHNPQKPASNFVPQELVSMKETRELREKVKELEDEVEALTAENMQLKIRLEQAQKPADPSAPAEKDAKKEADSKKESKDELGPDGKPLKPKS